MKTLFSLLLALVLVSTSYSQTHTLSGNTVVPTGSSFTIQSGVTGTWDVSGITITGLTVTGTVPSTRTLTIGPTTSDLSANRTFLANVTDDTQTKASIVPNTAPLSGQILIGNVGNTAYAKQTISGSGATISLSSAGVISISAIPNATLSNSAITIAGTSTSLGGSITQDTITGLSSTGYIKRTGANTLSTVSTVPNADLTNSAITIAGTSTALGGSITQDTITGLSSNGLVKRTGANTLSTTADNSTNWDTAYTDRLKWDGGATGLVAATGRTSLGATTVGSNLFTLATPAAVSWIEVSAAGVVSTKNQFQMQTDLSLLPGTDIEAWSQNLDDLANLVPAQGDIIYYNGASWRALNAGTAGNQLTTHGVGTDPTWDASGGGGTPGGANMQVQFNDSSAFGGDAGLTYDKTTDSLTVAGNMSTTSGSIASGTDLYTVRNYAPTTGAVFFGNTGSAYLYWDGSKYRFNSANVQSDSTFEAVTGYLKGGAEFPIAANGLVKRTGANTYVAATAGTDYIATTEVSDTAFASSWNGVTTIAPTKNAVYDWAHVLDTDDDGKVNVLDLGVAELVKTDASGVVSNATAGTDYLAPSAISDTAFASSWDGVTTVAPSKNAIYDREIASGAWDGIATVSGSNATTTGQTLVDVTGLVTPTLAAATKYEIEVILDVTTSAVTTGCQYAIQTGGTGGAGVISVILTGNTTGTTASSEALSTTPATASTARLLTSGQSGTMILKGEVTTRGTGTTTISVQHLKVTSGTSTVKIGSVLKYRKV